MAITSQIVKRSKLGNAFMNTVDLQITEEFYATGGLDIPLAKLGLAVPYSVIPAPSGGFVYEYDHTNNKLKAFTFATSLGIDYTSVKGAWYDVIDAKETTDEDNLPLNANLYAPFTPNTSTNEWAAAIKEQPDVPRNVTITIHNPTTGALNMKTAGLTFAVVGTFQGGAQTENITFTVTNSNKSVAAGKYRYLAGDKPFTTITSIVADTTGNAAGFHMAAGPGVWFGLPGGITNKDSVTDIKADNTALSHATDHTDETSNACLVRNDDTATLLANGKRVRITYTPTTAFGLVSNAQPKELINHTQITARLRVIAIGT